MLSKNHLVTLVSCRPFTIFVRYKVINVTKISNIIEGEPLVLRIYQNIKHVAMLDHILGGDWTTHLKKIGGSKWIDMFSPTLGKSIKIFGWNKPIVWICMYIYIYATPPKDLLFLVFFDYIFVLLQTALEDAPCWKNWNGWTFAADTDGQAREV